jgi:hypothetical protein
MAVPVLMYGSENWAINRSDKQKIESAEIKFFKTNSRAYHEGPDEK